MAKLCAVLTSSLRPFQSRLPLKFIEFVPNLFDLRSTKSIEAFLPCQQGRGGDFHVPGNSRL